MFHHVSVYVEYVCPPLIGSGTCHMRRMMPQCVKSMHVLMLCLRMRLSRAVPIGPYVTPLEVVALGYVHIRQSIDAWPTYVHVQLFRSRSRPALLHPGGTHGGRGAPKHVAPIAGCLEPSGATWLHFDRVPLLDAPFGGSLVWLLYSWCGNGRALLCC